MPSEGICEQGSPHSFAGRPLASPSRVGLAPRLCASTPCPGCPGRHACRGLFLGSASQVWTAGKGRVSRARRLGPAGPHSCTESPPSPRVTGQSGVRKGRQAGGQLSPPSPRSSAAPKGSKSPKFRPGPPGCWKVEGQNINGLWPDF